MQQLENKIKNSPKSPGVYLYKHNSIVIYVGKARNLRNRLKQYFTGNLRRYIRSYERGHATTFKSKPKKLHKKLIATMEPRHHEISTNHEREFLQMRMPTNL